MQEIAQTVVQTLPHTPMSAVGINFQYLVNDPAETLLDVFRLSDSGALADYGVQVKTTTIRRSTTLNDATVNLILALRNDGSATVEFNNHVDVKTGEQAQIAIRRPILELRQASVDGMKAIYGLEVDSP